MDETTAKRQAKNKDALLEQLAKTPIVQIACEKTSVSRATYYRWRHEDQEFADNADKAIGFGNLIMNDMAESQLLSLIKDKNVTAIIFWLKHHNPIYAPRLEISANNRDVLTDEHVNQLTQLLYDKNTFKQGQELLTNYVVKGYISEKLAQLMLKMFVAQLRVEDVMTRKAETEVMTEVMKRKSEYMQKKKLKHGL